MKTFAKWTLIISIILLVGFCGFFILSAPKSEIEILEASVLDTDKTLDYQTEQTSCEDCVLNEDGSTMKGSLPENFEIINAENVVYDVIFVNFSDNRLFNNQTYPLQYAKFEAVRQYYSEISLEKISMNFNYYLYESNLKHDDVCYNDFNYIYERSLWQMAHLSAVEVQHSGLNGQGKILVLAHDKGLSTRKITHPHVWQLPFFSERLMIVNMSSNVDSISHEMAHTFGLPDLYSSLWPNTFMNYDILDDPHSTQNPIIAHFRKEVGWFEESSISDGIKSEIEVVENSGRYTIYTPTTKNQTLAIKFGEYGKECFYIESRNLSPKSNILTVYRINEKYWGNLDAKKQSQCHVAHIASIVNEKDIMSKTGTPKEKDCIYYSDEKPLAVTITNVEFGENYITFDLIFGEDFGIEGAINVTSVLYNTPIPSADVYINNEFFAKTNSSGQVIANLNQGDVIKVVAENYFEAEYIVSYTNYNFTDTEISIKLIPNLNEQLNSYYKFNLILQDTGESYSVNPTLCKFYVNSDLIKYSSLRGLYLKNGDSLKITSNFFEDILLTHNGGVLSNSSLNVSATNNTFTINATALKMKYMINLHTQNGEFSPATKISVHNALSGKWTTIKNVSTVYSGSTKYYLLTNISSTVDKIKFEYNAYGTNSQTEVEIIPNQSTYSKELSKGFFQNAGDFVNNIKNSISNFFQDLFS